MKTAAPLDSLNGTIAEVAAFFRVSERTVYEWKQEKEIGCWQSGRSVVFGEEDVIEFYVKRHNGARGYRPGELEELARKQWREHLKLARVDLFMPVIADLQRRVDQLEKKEAA